MVQGSGIMFLSHRMHSLMSSRVDGLAGGLTFEHSLINTLCQMSLGDMDLIGKEFKFKNNLSRRLWPL